jgi:hypothetical protein
MESNGLDNANIPHIYTLTQANIICAFTKYLSLCTCLMKSGSGWYHLVSANPRTNCVGSGVAHGTQTKDENTDIGGSSRGASSNTLVMQKRRVNVHQRHTCKRSGESDEPIEIVGTSPCNKGGDKHKEEPENVLLPLDGRVVLA